MIKALLVLHFIANLQAVTVIQPVDYSVCLDKDTVAEYAGLWTLENPGYTWDQTWECRRRA